MKNAIVVSLAIIVIGALTAFALYLGKDGAIFATSLTILGGLAGYKVGKK